MIYLITGSNAYQADAEVRQLSGAFQGEVERYDGDDLTLEALADIVRGQMLFAATRFIIIRDLARNKPVWEKIPTLLEQLDDDTTIVFVESNPDKRTKTYKSLSAKAKVILVNEWTERDTSAAREWLRREAKQHGVKLKTDQEAEIVERATLTSDAGKRVIDQYTITHVLERLPAGEVSNEAINAMLPESTQANVFGLLELAIGRETSALERALERLRHTEDAYKVIGLVASQWAQLIAVKFADKPPSAVAADIGAPPFTVQQMARIARDLSTSDAAHFTSVIADMDTATKTTPLNPWVLLERFLRELAARA